MAADDDPFSAFLASLDVPGGPAVLDDAGPSLGDVLAARRARTGEPAETDGSKPVSSRRQHLTDAEAVQIAGDILQHPGCDWSRWEVRGQDPTSDDEKFTVLHDMALHAPIKLLERFGECLTDDQLVLMGELAHEAVTLAVRRIQVARRQGNAGNDVLIRNRRFAHMQQLLQAGTYFSDAAIKERAPDLYYQFVGRFDTSSAAADIAATSLAEVLTRGALHAERAALAETSTVSDAEVIASSVLGDLRDKGGHDADEGDEEEWDDDTDECMDWKPSAEVAASMGPRDVQHAMARAYQYQQADAQESKQQHVDAAGTFRDDVILAARQQLLQLMQARFIAGEEPHFDYRLVDEDERLDAVAESIHDAEEAYFDTADDDMHG